MKDEEHDAEVVRFSNSFPSDSATIPVGILQRREDILLS